MAQPHVHRAETPSRVRLIVDVTPDDRQQLLEEETMPESPLHDHALDVLKALLVAWAGRSGRDVFVARNLACRTDPRDARIGVDPDLCLVEPTPPDVDVMKQLRVWEPGHAPPFLAVEVVSKQAVSPDVRGPAQALEATGRLANKPTAEKDYRDAPVRYARLGVRELWIFDPTRDGPTDNGGPFVLQVWRREGDEMRRVHAGDAPARSPELDAWLVLAEQGRVLRLADEADGRAPWRTREEAAEEEAEQLRRRIAELEARR